MNKVRFINMLAMLGLATIVTGWSFWRFSAADQGEQALWEMTGQMGLDQKISVTETSVLRQNGRDAVLLLPGASATLTWDEAKDHIDVDLESGEMLFSTLAGDFTLRVSNDFVNVDSENNMFYMDASENTTKLFALQHASTVDLMSEGAVLNTLPVPSSYRLTVPHSKLTPTVGRLRLTKLSKEFPAFPLKDEDLTEVLVEAIEDTEAKYSKAALDLLNVIQKNGELGPNQEGFSNLLSKNIQGFEEAVTFLPHAEDRLDHGIKDELLTYAMTNLLNGDESSGLAWLSQWEALPKDSMELRDLYSSLFFILPGDELYPVKDAASGEGGLKQKVHEVEDLLDSASNILADEAYDDYKKDFQAQLDAGQFDDPMQLAWISREYLLLEQLLRQHVVFYSVEDTELLTDLELKILSLAGSDQELDEERLAFVQSKLRYLDNLFDFTIDKLVSVEIASSLAEELTFQARTYLNEVQAEVAVAAYFDSQLEEYELATGFLNSPEFFFYDSYEDGLEAYETKLRDLDDLNDYLQNLRSDEFSRGEIDPHPELDDAIDIVESDLKRNGVQFADIEHLGDAENRLFEVVGARTEGIGFDANYDRESELLYDVVVADVRFSTGILLSSAQEVIPQALVEEEFVEVELEEEPQNSDSLTETVALDFVESQFEAAGLDADKFDFTVTDVSQNLFSFSGVITGENLPVSGVYMGLEGRVMGVVWEYNGVPQTFPNVDLDLLESTLFATYQALEAAGQE